MIGGDNQEQRDGGNEPGVQIGRRRPREDEKGDVEKNRAEGKKIMESLGYTAEKPLKIKLITRNIATSI